MVKLSIIIPHYNSVNPLKKLIASIPRINSIQIIVVDDNSKKDLDVYHDLVNNPAFVHVTFLTNNKGKKGAGVCRNIGLEAAEGEWILFADADDYFLENFYEIVRDYFDSENDVVFFTPTSIETDTGNVSDRHFRYEKVISTYQKLDNLDNRTHLRYGFPGPWSKLIRRKLLVDNNIYFDEVLASNDAMFSVKVGYYMKHFLASEKKIYCLTRNRGSLTMNVSVGVFDARLDTYIRCHQFLIEKISKEEVDILNRNGRYFIINAIKYKYGLKKILKTYRILRQNNFRIFDTRFLNPIFLINRTLGHYRSHKQLKKYLYLPEKNPDKLGNKLK